MASVYSIKTWTDKGFTKEEAEEKCKSYRRISPFKIEHWIQKGYSQEDAEFQCKATRPIMKEYWIKRGHSEEEATKLAIDKKESNNKSGSIKSGLRDKEEIRKVSKRCKEYWLERGYSEDDAINEVSKIQSTFSLEKCIEKHGLESGTEIWKKRQENWMKSLYDNNDIEQLNKSKNCLSYKKLQSKFDTLDDIVLYLEKSRNIKIVKTIEEFEDKIKTILIDSPEKKYHTPEQFVKSLQKLQFEVLDIRDACAFVSRFLEDPYTLHKVLGGRYIHTRMKTDDGVLRSTHEIYFWELLKKYNINFTLDGNYPNSSFRYDFYLTDYELYVEICPLRKTKQNVKYIEKMKKKVKMFGCIPLDTSKQYEEFLKEVINGSFDKTDNRFL